jgi:hypothetical protein
MLNGYMISINLLKFIDARLLTIEEDENGERVEGLFIPIEKNGVRVTKKCAYMQAYMTPLRYTSDKHHSHYLRMQLPKNDYFKYVKELGYSAPVIGYSIPTTFSEKGVSPMMADAQSRMKVKRVGTQAYGNKKKKRQ